MKSKKKNEMEKAQNTKGAAQELDMDALEDVSGGTRMHHRPLTEEEIEALIKRDKAREVRYY